MILLYIVPFVWALTNNVQLPSVVQYTLSDRCILRLHTLFQYCGMRLNTRLKLVCSVLQRVAACSGLLRLVVVYTTWPNHVYCSPVIKESLSGYKMCLTCNVHQCITGLCFIHVPVPSHTYPVRACACVYICIHLKYVWRNFGGSSFFPKQ